MMNKHTKIVGALAAATTMAAGYALAGTPVSEPAPAPAPSRGFFEGELHVGYNSMYEFRFVDLGQDMIEAGADVAFDLGSGFSINAGAWYASTNDSKPFGRGAGDFNELDLYAGLRAELEWVDLEVGYIFYHLPGKVFNGIGWNSLDTQELYASVGFKLPWEIGFGVTTYYDFQRYDGLYVNPEFTKSFEITECFGIDLAVGCGWANGHGLQLSRDSLVFGGNPGGTVDGYQGWYASASFPWKVTDTFTVAPYVKYTDGDSDLLTNLTDITGGQDYFLGGVILTVSF